MLQITNITAVIYLICQRSMVESNNDKVDTRHIRLAFDLILHLCYTYFVIMSIDSGIWNVNLPDCRYFTFDILYYSPAINLSGFDVITRHRSAIRRFPQPDIEAS